MTHRRPAGFTLVELLVVISIIALLIAILLPALANARNAARNVICAAKLQQMAVAVTAYRVDYDDYVGPPGGGPSQGGGANTGFPNVTWDEWLMPYMNLEGVWDPTVITPIDLEVPVYACPFDESVGIDGRPARSYSFNIGYDPVTPFADDPFRPDTIRARFINAESGLGALNRIVMIGDWFSVTSPDFATVGRKAGSTRIWFQWYGTSDENRRAVHQGLTANANRNALFFDMHVENLAYEPVELLARPLYDYNLGD